MTECEHETEIRKSDWQLLDEYVESGSPAAFRSLVHRHGQMVFASCQRMLGDAHLAEEAAQDAFILLGQKGKHLDRKTTAVAGWLHRSAWNICRMKRRSEQRRQKRETSEFVVDWQESSNTEPWQELKPQLDHSLAQLSSKFRDVIVLCYIEGRTQKEAASQLSCSESAVSKRLKKGIETLRRLMPSTRSGLSAVAVIAALEENALDARDTVLLDRIAEASAKPIAASSPLAIGGFETQFLGTSLKAWLGTGLAALSIVAAFLVWQSAFSSGGTESILETAPSPAQATPHAPGEVSSLSQNIALPAPRVTHTTRIERSLTTAFFAQRAADRFRILKGIGIPFNQAEIEAIVVDSDWESFESALLMAWAKSDPITAIHWRLSYSLDCSFLVEDWIKRDVDAAIDFLNTEQGKRLANRDLLLVKAHIRKTPLEAREIILQGNAGSERNELLTLLAKQWPKDRLDEATLWASSNLQNKLSWQTFSETLLLRLATTNPDAAIELLPHLGNSFSFPESVRVFAQTLSSKRPERAIQIYSSLGTNVRSEIAIFCAQGMAESNFELTYAWSLTLPPQERHLAMQGILSVAKPEELKTLVELYFDSNYDSLSTSSLLDGLGDNQRYPEECAAYALRIFSERASFFDTSLNRHRALSNSLGIVGNLCLAGSFHGAADFIDQLPFQTEPEKRTLAERLLSRWAIVEPEEAALWTKNGPWSARATTQLLQQIQLIDSIFKPYR